MNAIIFDLDGTLVDSLADIAAAMNHALRSVGMPPHPLARYREIIGDGVRKLAERALPPGRADLVDKILAVYRPYYDGHALDATRPYPGIPELVAAVRVPMAVLSNKPDEPTRAIVDALFPGAPFRVVAGERPSTPRKPNPAGALAVAAALGVAPESCLFVGDSRTDMRTAVAAGMTPIGVAWGFRPPDELRDAGARAIVAAPAEILAWI
ncbi:MAG TPA: HAD family hydrolase [Haliangiales bacterium]|nr:HAD family hydrolase [Haliangiales bacterium]